MLTISASPIAVATWSPILLFLRLRSQESERIVECWSRKGQEVVSGSRETERLPEKLASGRAPLTHTKKEDMISAVTCTEVFTDSPQA